MSDHVLLPGGTAPFDITMLGEALVRRMTEAFIDFRLRNDNPDVQVPADPDAPMPEIFEPVTVYLGSVKARGRTEAGVEVAPKFPLVLVKPWHCTDDVANDDSPVAAIKVDFVIGARRLDVEGFLDVTAIIERIRRNLLVSPIIENRARLELPLESEIGDDDAFPQWFGVVSATFIIPQLVEEIAND